MPSNLTVNISGLSSIKDALGLLEPEARSVLKDVHKTIGAQLESQSRSAAGVFKQHSGHLRHMFDITPINRKYAVGVKVVSTAQAPKTKYSEWEPFYGRLLELGVNRTRTVRAHTRRYPRTTQYGAMGATATAKAELTLRRRLTRQRLGGPFEMDKGKITAREFGTMSQGVIYVKQSKPKHFFLPPRPWMTPLIERNASTITEQISQSLDRLGD